MEQRIINKLHEIENSNNIRILLAVESGSRAWGFASPDSDYDVRFIYMHPKDDYLRLETIRDVIELPIENMLDINGWDLKKTLQLLYKSNPTLFEWFSSPIVYIETQFADQFRSIMYDYFSTKRSLYHYISMAQSHYSEYLRYDIVKVKKYFYVLRPVLACRWILNEQTPPPMRFSELMEAELPKTLHAEVNKLLDLKIHSPEIKKIAKIHLLNEYLASSIQDIKRIVQTYKETKNANWQELNDLFLQALQYENKSDTKTALG